MSLLELATLVSVLLRRIQVGIRVGRDASREEGQGSIGVHLCSPFKLGIRYGYKADTCSRGNGDRIFLE